MAESCCRPRTYEKITDEQRKILSSYYDNGMTTTGSNMQNIIEEAATKAKLDIERVKVRSITIRSAEHNLHFTRRFVLIFITRKCSNVVNVHQQGCCAGRHRTMLLFFNIVICVLYVV